MLVLVAFGCGLGAGAFWMHRVARSQAATAQASADAAPVAGLSDGTKAILKRLSSPVEIKFYSLLEAPGTPETLKAFAHRVDELLSLYQQEGDGKLKVTRCTSQSNANVNAAVADGIQPRKLESGDEYFLGVAVLNEGRRESLARLSPEWEAALEIDLTRAIANAIESAPGAGGGAPGNLKPVTAAAVEDLKRLIPDPDSMSLEDGTRLLRQAALKDFAQAAQKSQAQLQEAQQRLAQAQSTGSSADQQAAVKALQEMQAGQTDRLKEIASQSQAQIEAWRRLKGAGR